jgi:hypothetical protein
MHDCCTDHRPGKEGDRVYVVVLLDHIYRARRGTVIVMHDRGRAMHHVMGLVDHYNAVGRAITMAVTISMAAPIVVAPVGERGGRNGQSGGEDSKLLEHRRLLSS